MKNNLKLNKIKNYSIIFFLSIKPMYASITIEGLKKLINKFADEDKSYITLYAAELGLDYDKYLVARRKQYGIEIKNYVLSFSPALTGQALSGKIEQDKIDWVNNNFEGILPKIPLAAISSEHPNIEINAPKTTTETPSTPAVATTSVTTSAPVFSNKTNKINEFHKISSD